MHLLSTSKRATAGLIAVMSLTGCATIIEGIRFDWEKGDIFVIPSWVYHEHLNDSKNERAILFSIQDTPILVALGKYREEALSTNDGHQVVKGVFDAEGVLAHK